MRQFLIDELRPQEVAKIRDYLREHALPGPLEGIFWVPLKEEHLAEAQKNHPDCAPFVFALELRKDSIGLELLIRSRKKLHCQCMQYATRPQQELILALAEDLIQALELKA